MFAAAPKALDGSELVNLKRYPVADLASPQARAVIEAGRAQLKANGLCLLDDFVTPEALAAMAAEGNALHSRAYYEVTWMEGAEKKPGVAPLHRPTRNACGAIAYDLLAPSSPTRRLYEWDGLVALFRELLEVKDFYRCADPISSCLLMYYADGDELGWHFDPNDGVVTLLLQAAVEGGLFEFAPGVGRDPARFDPIMDGSRRGVVSAPLRPGTLALFQGVNAMHRVTPVSGPRPRIMLTMSFHDRPGMMFTPENRRRYSGRMT